MTTTRSANSVWFEGRAGRMARLAILSGVLVHLAGFLIFHVVTEPSIEPMLPAPFASVAASSKAAEELVALAALSDSEPLFLPTQWNAAAPRNLVVDSQMHTQPFDTFPPDMSLGPNVFPTQAQMPQSLPQSPDQALLLEPGLVFSTFGRDRTQPTSDSSVGLRMELYNFQNGKLLGQYRLESDVFGETPPSNWRYAEFQILIDDTGQIGIPLLITSSDVESVDRALSNYLHRRLIDENLKPGYYRVIIGP